jgi:hypothetical protein
MANRVLGRPRLMLRPATRLATHLRSARSGAAAVVCLLAAGALGSMSAGCFDTASLGSGEGGSGGVAGPQWKPRIIWVEETEEEVTVGGNQCLPGLTTDLDNDGFSAAQGDCNDCDPDMGPSAVEMPTLAGEPAKDEDCDGLVDEGDQECDAGLLVNDPFAMSAARALDLCEVAGNGRWGVERAVWVLADGEKPPMLDSFALGHGLIDRFGPNVGVRHGQRMLALSTGTARQPTDPGYVDPRGFDKGYESKPVDGFPSTTPTCPGVVAGAPHDSVALELVLRVPQNADALAFDFDFYTYELPERACSSHDDAFVALLSTSTSSPAFTNVALDGAGNLVRVNGALMDACSCEGGPPCFFGGREHPCSLGGTPLLGTGFGKDTSPNLGDRAATGWLTTSTPVERGSQITLRLAIQDAGDPQLDSTVLVDHVRWRRGEPQVAKVRRDDAED